MNTPKCFDVCINNLQYIFGKVITRFLKSIEEKKIISTSTKHELVIPNSTQKKNMLTNQAIWQI